MTHEEAGPCLAPTLEAGAGQVPFALKSCKMVVLADISTEPRDHCLITGHLDGAHTALSTCIEHKTSGTTIAADEMCWYYQPCSLVRSQSN